MLWVLQFALLSESFEPKITHTLEFTVTYKLKDDTAQRERIIKLDLFGEKCPLTVNNFYTLAVRTEQPNYLNSIFHRIVKDFVLQGGDITNMNGTGTYSVYGREFIDEISETNNHIKGALSMANRGKNTNGSQFFIVTAKEAFFLNDKHTVFGAVRPECFDVLDDMNSITVNSVDRPIDEVRVTSIRDVSADRSLVEAVSKLAMELAMDMQKDELHKEAQDLYEQSQVDSGYEDSFDNMTSEELELLLKKYQQEKEDGERVDL